jgi:hypothetical protein
MTKTQRAQIHRADAPRQWQEALLEIRDSQMKNRELARIAEPLVTDIKHLGAGVAMEIVLAIGIQLAIAEAEGWR